MIVYLQHPDGAWRPTQFRSLSCVKRWATRWRHAYEVRDGVLIVSTADGSIHRYSARASKAVRT